MTFKYYLSDMRMMLGRCLKHVFRNLDSVITVVAMPILMLLMFVYVFGGAINVGSGSYINYMLPGIVLMSVSNAVAYTAVRLNNDVTKGIFERFHSMPIYRTSILWGHVLTSLTTCAISMAVIFLIALLMGFEATAGILGWLAAVGILLLYMLATTWLAVFSALLAKTAEGASAFSYPLAFLPFLSSAFVPTETMPGIVRSFAENQPVTSIVAAVRAFLHNQPVGSEVVTALIWCLGVLLVAYLLAMWAYRRKIA